MTSPSIDRRYGTVGSIAFKAPCRAATTAATTLEGEQTINGVAIVSGDRVLVKDQSTASSNGIYVADTGEWSRAIDADGNYDFVNGTLLYVTNGTSLGKGIWRVTSTSSSIEIGTDSIAFTAVLLTT